MILSVAGMLSRKAFVDAATIILRVLTWTDFWDYGLLGGCGLISGITDSLLGVFQKMISNASPTRALRSSS